MDEKMEIRLVNPTEDGFLQKIDWNKAELDTETGCIARERVCAELQSKHSRRKQRDCEAKVQP